MVVQLKKHDSKKLRICVDFRGLNKLTVIDFFPTPYADEIINEVVGHECYSFTDRFSRYNQVLISQEDRENHFCIGIHIFFLQSYALWSKECTCCILKSCSQSISRIHLQNNDRLLWWLDNIQSAEKPHTMAKNDACLKGVDKYTFLSI